jgi:hypothetical protein
MSAVFMKNRSSRGMASRWHCHCFTHVTLQLFPRDTFVLCRMLRMLRISKGRLGQKWCRR